MTQQTRSGAGCSSVPLDPQVGRLHAEIASLRRAAGLAWVAMADIRDLQCEDWNGHAAMAAIEKCMSGGHQITQVLRDAERYAALRILGVEFSDYSGTKTYQVCLEALDDAIDDVMARMPPNALAQADAACGVSPGAMGCTSNGRTEDGV